VFRYSSFLFVLKEIENIDLLPQSMTHPQYAQGKSGNFDSALAQELGAMLGNSGTRKA
jgi:hypothetical protein